MPHSLLVRHKHHRCGLVIPFPGLPFLQPFLYSMTHIPTPFITNILHLSQGHMAQLHTNLPRLQAWDLTVVPGTLAISPAGVLRAVTIPLLTAAGSLPVAAVVVSHPVAAAVVSLQAVVVFPLAAVLPVAAVIPLAVVAVHPAVVVVPQVLLPDLLPPPPILLPPNHSP